MNCLLYHLILVEGSTILISRDLLDQTLNEVTLLITGDEGSLIDQSFSSLTVPGIYTTITICMTSL